MSDSTESRLQTAYELIKAGRQDQAYDILVPLVRADPTLADGWFLLGHAVSDSQEKIRCFQQVLRLDPANQPAQEQLARLQPQSGGRPAAVPQPGKKGPAGTAKKSAPPKPGPARLWGLAGLAGLFLCLLGLGLAWSFSQPLFASRAPAAATTAQPTVALAAATAKPGRSSTPKPTSRPTITMVPTATPQPSVTTLPTSTPLPTPTPTPGGPTDAPKPKGFTGCSAPNGLGMLTAPFKVENFGKERATVYLNGKSKNGNYQISCKEIVKQGIPVFWTLMWGDYEYIIFRGSTTMRGSFFINQETKSTMRIFSDKIQIGEFP
jgi:hypothetical protein